MKVLLIRLSSLGDVVLATAAVEALRAARPEARIEVLTKPAFREVFANHPGVARLVPWDPEDGVAALARRLRRGRYDWVVDLHANLRTRLLRLLLRGPRWSVYRKGALRRRLAVWLRRPELLDGQPHVVERYTAALAPLGVPPVRVLPRVVPGPEDVQRAERLLAAAGWDGQQPCVALAPGARWATKAWPEERWRELLAHLAQGAPEAFPVLVGGAGERDLCDRILGTHRGAALAGATGILETAAVLQHCRVLVTNDSAPLHLATAVGTRVVALFGPTVRGFGFFPLGMDDVVLERLEPCRPCRLHGGARCRTGLHSCLSDLAAETVIRSTQPLHGDLL